jgi:hypothetical protein
LKRFHNAAPNKPFNRSGDCVAVIILLSFNLGWFRAARLIRALAFSAKRKEHNHKLSVPILKTDRDFYSKAQYLAVALCAIAGRSVTGSTVFQKG